MTLHTMDFRGQRAWVTGAAQGIGRQVALQLHARGAEVIGLDCQFTAEPCGFRCEHLDIAQPAAVAQLCQRLLAEGMAPDVLINAAGILRLGNSDELSLEDWQACLDVNVSGVFYLLRELVPHFKRQGPWGYRQYRLQCRPCAASTDGRILRVQGGAGES